MLDYGATLMSTDHYFTVNEFAKMSRTTKDTLRHYDKIGLLSPVTRGENNYRYYSRKQLAHINVIRTLQELGMSLVEIKNLKDRRTPKRSDKTFEQQIVKIDTKIEEWMKARKLLLTLQRMIRSVSNINEKEISIQFVPAETIILGELNDYSQGKDDYDALSSFYRNIGAKYQNLGLSYPVWAIFSKDRIEKGDWKYPDRYYFYNPGGHDVRPAAWYAVGYTHGKYGQTTKLYQRMINYIETSGWEICGDTYEEYPLNEISVANERDYLIRVMIAVRKRENDEKELGTESGEAEVKNQL